MQERHFPVSGSPAAVTSESSLSGRQLRWARRSVRLGLFLGSLVASALVSQAALEAPVWAAEKASVAVGGFDGTKADEVRSAFIDALKKAGNYEVTDAEDIKASAKGKAVADAAKGLAVGYVITGKVAKGFNLKLKVMKADGKVVNEVEVKGGDLDKLKGEIDSSGVASVAEALGQPKPAAEEKKEEPKEDAPAEEKPAEEASADASVDTSDLPDAGGLAPLEVFAGLRPLHRTFSFTGTLPGAKPPHYELPLGPVLFIDVNLWGSLLGAGPLQMIGLTGGFEKGFATESVWGEGTNNKKTLKTNLQQWYAGARFRLPIAAHTLGLSATYGQHTFELSGDESGPVIPDVRYDYVRAGLDGTLSFGDFWIGARFGSRFVLKPGSLKSSEWFTNVKTKSLEAGVTLGYRLASMLDLTAGFDWLRYGFNFNPVAPNPPPRVVVAGGAEDEYLSGFIGFRFHLPAPGAAPAAPAQ